MNLSTTIFGLTTADTRTVAGLAEAGGFDTVWLADHAVTPVAFDPYYPYDPTGRPGYPPETPLVDVWVMIGHLAATLPRINFGTGVYILPLRHPLVIAQAMRTAFEVAGGRLIAGFGTGWMREEFDAMCQPFDDRGTRADEMLDIIEHAWTGSAFEYHGRHYQLALLQQGGAPLPHVPKVFGGTTRRALERCARRGDGWFGPPATDVESAIRHRETLEAMRKSLGRTNPFRYYVRVPGRFTERSYAPYRDAGFEDLVVSLPRREDGSIDMHEVTEFVHAAGERARAAR
jgi:probable F420-dependent oxidoreductase